MDKLLALYDQLNTTGVSFFTWDLGEDKASTMEMNGLYAVFMDFDNIHSKAEESVVLAHEGGHASTGSTHKVCSPYDLVEKHEYKAWKWAVQRLISCAELDDAIADGCCEMWELAERFGVTQEFMEKAVCWHTYGNLAVEEYMAF